MDSWKEGNDIALLLIVAFQFRKLSFASQIPNAQLSNINIMWLKYVTFICTCLILLFNPCCWPWKFKIFRSINYWKT